MSVKYRIRTVQGLVAKAYPDADSANEVARQWRLQGMIDVSVVEVIENSVPDVSCFDPQDYSRGLVFRDCYGKKSFLVWFDEKPAGEDARHWQSVELIPDQGAVQTFAAETALNDDDAWQGLRFVDTADRYLLAAKNKAPAVAEWLENWLSGRAS